MAQTAAPPEAPATLNAVDFNFVGQANLGDSGLDGGLAGWLFVVE
jgi:hypothetical protein